MILPLLDTCLCQMCFLATLEGSMQNNRMYSIYSVYEKDNHLMNPYIIVLLYVIGIYPTNPE